MCWRVLLIAVAITFKTWEVYVCNKMIAGRIRVVAFFEKDTHCIVFLKIESSIIMDNNFLNVVLILFSISEIQKVVEVQIFIHSSIQSSQHQGFLSFIKFAAFYHGAQRTSNCSNVDK